MERFTISLDDKLAREFDDWAAERGYGNRSEAFRDIVRAEMDRQRLSTDPKGHCVACLSYVYNHHERDLAERLMTLQHEHHDLTLSTMHAHLDHEHCIETVLLRGRVAGSTDQVPQRAVESSEIGRYGAIDPSDSGQATADLHSHPAEPRTVRVSLVVAF